MGPDKDSLTPAKNQDARSTPRSRGGLGRARRPRRRVCLLKGCGRVFRAQQPMARYCSEACQAEARRWRQWKARRRYRQSPNGKQKRQAQNRRYRARRKEQQGRETTAVAAARVIPTRFFFVLLRPSRVLCGIPAHPAVAPAAVLFPRLSSRAGTGAGARAALAPTMPGPTLGPSLGEKGPAPAAIKTCRDRPDILHSFFLSR
jgi:hypothetical protein